MTTIREQSTAALAEALYDAGPPRFDRTIQQQAEAYLAVSPTLARRLDLGTAWDEAVAALPEGWVLTELRLHDDRSGWGAEAYNDTGVGRYRQMGYGQKPTDALVALAEALEANR